MPSIRDHKQLVAIISCSLNTVTLSFPDDIVHRVQWMNAFTFEPVHLQTRSISVTRDSTFVCTAWAFRSIETRI